MATPSAHPTMEYNGFTLVLHTPESSVDQLVTLLEKAPAFKNWLDNVKTGGHIQAEGAVIDIHSVLPSFSNPLFVEATSTFKPTSPHHALPPISVHFIRANSVAPMVLVRSGTRTFIPLVRQLRTAAARPIIELPAGAFDGKGTLWSNLMRELREETGIELKSEDISYQGSFYPSPGATVESITIGRADVSLSEAQCATITSKSHGVAEEGERTNVFLIDTDDISVVAFLIGDSKLSCALFNLMVMSGNSSTKVLTPPVYEDLKVEAERLYKKYPFLKSCVHPEIRAQLGV